MSTGGNKKRTTQSDLYGTPPEFYEVLDKEFHFTLDPCADDNNHKCDTYYTETDNGLLQPWAPHVVFVNPPYSANLVWSQKAAEEMRKGAVVVLLMSNSTDARWFQFLFSVASEVRFLPGRLKFIVNDVPAKSPTFGNTVFVLDGTRTPEDTPKVFYWNWSA